MNHSTTGRPRRLTDVQIQQILAMYRARPTVSYLAGLFGVSHRLISTILKTKGQHYKRESPDK